MRTENIDDLINVSTAAERLNKHTTFIWRLMEQGELDVVAIDKTKFLKRAQVEGYRIRPAGRPKKTEGGK